MKTVKSLLLGSAAGFVAFTGAQAADLPMAEPVEYVKVCSTYGEGFFYIPGTDTCLQISGKVRADFIGAQDDFEDDDAGDSFGFGDESDNDFETDVRGVIAADARSETEWGTLRAYVEFEGRSRTGLYPNGRSGLETPDNDVAGPAVELIAAFVQFAGITAGYSSSFYDFVEYDSVGDFFSAEDVNTLAYTASFGSGFAATIGIEDKNFRAFPSLIDTDGDDLTDPEESALDQVWPNVIAAIRVDQAWGAAQISGAVQDNEGDLDDALGFEPEDDIGYAVQAGVKFNLPFANEGTYVWAQGAYSEGAISYAGAEDVTGNGYNLGFDLSDQSIDGSGENNEMWQVGGGLGIQLSETVRSSLMATYWEYDDSALETLEVISAEGNIFWTPVDNLDLGLAVIYTHAEQDASTAGVEDGDADSLWGVLRVERSF